MLIQAIIFSLIGGSGIFLGAFLARYEHLRSKWLESELKHGLIAFGGGALLSAISLVLIPDGIKNQPVYSVIFSFLAGGLIFMFLMRYLERRKTLIAQLIAMLLDFIPESMIVGAVITDNYHQALLLTFMIFIQNIPESFNAFYELRKATRAKSKKLLASFLIIGCVGPVCAMTGYGILHHNPAWLSVLMTFCSGGILYIVFNNIAPQAKLNLRWLPAMGALMGYLAGIVFQLILV